jgi:hypothetical protein
MSTKNRNKDTLKKIDEIIEAAEEKKNTTGGVF